MYTGSELKLNKEECKAFIVRSKRYFQKTSGTFKSYDLQTNDKTYYLFLLIASTFNTRLIMMMMIDDDL